MEERPGHRDFQAFPRVKDFQADTRKYFIQSPFHIEDLHVQYLRRTSRLRFTLFHMEDPTEFHDFRPFTCAKDFQATKCK